MADFLSEDAKQVLENNAFKAALQGLGDYLERNAIGCDPDNIAMTQRIIIGKQLLAGIKRELERMIAAGEYNAQLQEVEKIRKFQR